MSTTPHPLLLTAAGAVTVASLAAVVYYTSLIHEKFADPPAQVATVAQPATASSPAAMSSPLPVASAASAPAAASAPSMAEPAQEQPRVKKPAPYRPHVSKARPPADSPIPPPPPPQLASPMPAPAVPPVTSPAPAPCRDCATVVDVREAGTPAPRNPGVGAVAGGVLGGVLGHQMGRGTGKDVATILGALGGAVAGHQIEKHAQGDRQFEVVVQLDDGAQRTLLLPHPQWRPGDRVRLTANGLAPL